MTNGSTPPGWYRDPTGQGDARYWNGTSWTQTVDRGGQQVNVPIDSTTAQQEPLPGTQVQLPQAPATTQVVQTSSGSSGGVLIGLVIALLLIVVVVVAVDNNDTASDSPAADTEAPAEDAPAEDAPAEDAPAEE